MRFFQSSHPSNKRRGIVLGLFAPLLVPVLCSTAAHAQKASTKFSGEAAYRLTEQFLAVAPHRWMGSPGHAKADRQGGAQSRPRHAGINAAQRRYGQDAGGFGKALQCRQQLFLPHVHHHELARAHIGEFNWIRVVGDAPGKGSILSFEAEGMHAHDLATILDREGVAVRAGHHCAQPLMERFGVASTSRASFALYNTRADVDALVAGLSKAREILG